MNIGTFWEHRGIAENPFRAEEARSDSVFARMRDAAIVHPDFDKIAGDPAHPAPAIVFGEKGSGKTAIRLQLARRVGEHNRAHPESRAFLVAYDDLTPVLERLCAALRINPAERSRELTKALQQIRLADHVDGLLGVAVPRLVDVILGAPDAAAGAGRDEQGSLGVGRDEARHALRRSAASVKQALAVLQALYDRADWKAHRAALVHRAIRGPIDWRAALWRAAIVLGWIPAAGVAAAAALVPRETVPPMYWLWAFAALAALWVLVIAKVVVLDRLRLWRHAMGIARRLRVMPKAVWPLADALAYVPRDLRSVHGLGLDVADDGRQGMLDRLRLVLGAMGCRGLIVIVDRVDEPPVIGGDPDRMKALVWPLLSNRFLQQEGMGLKLLLPVELKHELFKESAVFFQEARLDKQNLIERLSWTGQSLYDLCNARLRACASITSNATAEAQRSQRDSMGLDESEAQASGPKPQDLSLVGLFEEDVTRQDLIDALDQMRQPRDAFKLIYRCVADHCAVTTDEQPKWRIPKSVLDNARRQHADRVQAFARGVRPA